MTRILVVDDDAFFGQMLLDWLLEQGYAGARVTTAELALDVAAVEDERPDIFLVDERLGSGLSGIELIARLREVAPESDAILFTGSADPEIARHAYLAGAWRYVRRPFDPNEMGYVLAALLQWRSARAAQYERDWLVILNRIVERLQYAHTVEQVGQVLVDGGVELGFDRARFYRVRTADGAPTLFGLCQSGANQVVNFEQVEYGVEKTIYHQKAFAERKPTFFRNRELGQSFLSTLPQAEGFPESLGEWVILPLFSGDECIGSVSMDNCRTAKSIHPQQKQLLRLFAGQSVSALERALQWEQARQEKEAENLARRIIRQMGNPATEGALEGLLLAIHENFLGKDRDDNFIIVLHDKESGWYRYRLHIESGERVAPSWCPPTQGGLIEYVMTQNSPLFLPSETAAFRKDNGIAQVGLHPARSWMGAPLRIGEVVAGAMVVENDHRDFAFNEEQFKRLVFLAERLVSVIQAAWLNEQEKEHSRLLHHLQDASELIPGFDEEKLWLTVLTLCTADYGAGFDRAMFFLAEEGETRLRGCMAIGHLKKEDAIADWEEYVRNQTGWSKFLDALQADALKPTPLNGAVYDYAFTVSDDDAFADTLRENRIMALSREDAQKRLPADFLDRFGVAGYCLVPVKAGEQMMGVVVLDNVWEKDPNQIGVLGILDNLTNQAALLAENLRKAKALEDMIAVQHEVLVQSTVRPLQETLQRICEAVRTIAGADLTAIYPLQENGEELRYDHQYSARVGRRNLSDQELSHAPTGLSRYALLEAKAPILISNVAEDETPYFGMRHWDMLIVKEEGIRATIAAPVFGLRRTGTARAMLYIDYHTPRAFSEHDRRMAEAFAHLIATAIANWRDAQGLRDTQEARDRELSRLSEVLKSSLAAESNERQIAQLLLDKVPALFAPLPVTTGVALKEWVRDMPDSEPMEMHHYLYPKDSPYEEEFRPAKDDNGICARAMRIPKIQNIGNAPADPDYKQRDRDTRSELDVPILVDGHVVAALNIESPQLTAFTAHHEEMGQRFADIAALAIGNARRQRNLQTVLAATSALTGPTDLQKTLVHHPA